MKNRKLIVISAAAIISFFQVLSTYSICRGQENIQMVYEVKPGENLQSVATKFGTTTEKLQKLNNIESVGAGMRLKVE